MKIQVNVFKKVIPDMEIPRRPGEEEVPRG